MSELCGAKTRQGGTCKRVAGSGTSHVGSGACKHHGGSTPSHEIAAARRYTFDLARTFGGHLDADPEEVLINELALANGIVAWLTAQVTTLGTDGKDAAQTDQVPHVWIRQLGEERDRRARVAKMCIDMGFEAKRIAREEQQAMLLAVGIRTILTRAGVNLDEEVSRIVREELTKIWQLESGRAQLPDVDGQEAA